MINLKSLLTEAKVPMISLQQAIDAKLFGPVYHGTSQENLSKIGDEGFKVVKGMYGSSGMSNGYQSNGGYGLASVPPPIHHLGFGVYFTTVKAIAKKFAGGTVRGMRVYYLKAPRIEEINFGSPNTMMKWWMKNGYDPELAQKGEGGRYAATVKLTEELSSKWDVVWYKGKGMYRLLDGDQVVAFDPSIVYEIDLSLSKGLDVGAKVTMKNDFQRVAYDGHLIGTRIPAGTRGIITKKTSIAQLKKDFPEFWAKDANEFILMVKFKVGGEQQVKDTEVVPMAQ